MNTIKVNRKDIKDSKTPIFDYCRTVVGQAGPEDLLEVWRNGILSMRVNIHEGAQLTVKEDPIPHFVRFKQMDEKDKARLRLKGLQKRLGRVTGAFKSKSGTKVALNDKTAK